MTRSAWRKMVATTIVLGGLLLPAAGHAVRANWGVRMVGPRLEKAKKFEEAACYYRMGLDFYAVVYQLWIDSAVYDERVDQVYQRGPAIFGKTAWRGAANEERWDTFGAYIVLFNREGASRCVDNGRFTASQRSRLEERLRVYTEDLLDPDHGFGGDFSFARKARILESVGLFRHASYRRELAGRYAIRVCSRYYAAVADELERAFDDKPRAALYRRRSLTWRERGFEELRRANGDRALARIKGGKPDMRLDDAAIRDVLRKGLASPDADTRLAAERVQGEAFREPLARTARNGLSPGILVDTFDGPRRSHRAGGGVFPTVDFGMKFRANFPKPWYDLWKKPDVFGQNAKGPFRLRVRATLDVPADGEYRFYVKTDVANRARVTLSAPRREVISPANDAKLLYVMQPGMQTHRIDFSRPVRLKKGLTDLTVVYDGDEVRKIHNTHMVRISGIHHAGIQLFWSSNRHLTELIPATRLFHREVKTNRGTP